MIWKMWSRFKKIRILLNTNVLYVLQYKYFCLLTSVFQFVFRPWEVFQNHFVPHYSPLQAPTTRLATHTTKTSRRERIAVLQVTKYFLAVTQCGRSLDDRESRRL